MTENQCTINVPNTSSTELAKEWARQVTSELDKGLQAENSSNQSERWKKQSIYKSPSSVTKLCEQAYEPQTVSIGPYHRGKEHLKGMEEHKLRALRQFLNRSGKPLEFCVDALAPVVEDLKDAYDQLDESWEQGTHKFLELMIVDGCFIFELVNKRITAQLKKNDNWKLNFH